jgi:hypothetical protein
MVEKFVRRDVQESLCFCDALQARLLSRLTPSPQAAAIEQGLHIIEQAHQLGPDPFDTGKVQNSTAGICLWAHLAFS